MFHASTFPGQRRSTGVARSVAVSLVTLAIAGACGRSFWPGPGDAQGSSHPWRQRSAARPDTAAPRPGGSVLPGGLISMREVADLIDEVAAVHDPTFHELALHTVVQLAGPRHPFEGYLRIRFARRARAAGDRASALDQAIAGEDILREHLHLRLQSLSEREALRLAKLRESALDLILSFAAEETSVRDRERCWDAFIRSRAVVLDEMAGRQRALIASGDSTLSRLAKALSEARRRLAEAAFREPADDGRTRTLLVALRGRRDSLERELARKSQAFRASLGRERAGLADVRAALDPGDALVAFAYYTAPGPAPRPRTAAFRFLDRAVTPDDSRVLAFVIGPGGAGTVVVPLGPASAIDAQLVRWYRSVARDLDGAEGEGPPASTVPGDSLRRRVWDPLAPHLEGAQRIFVVLEGALQLVSLDALPLSPKGDVFLAERAGVFQYVTAERDLTARGSREPACGLLVVGGVDYGGVRTSPNLRGEAEGGWDPCGGPGAGAGLDALPASRHEVAEVARLWREADESCSVLVLVGDEASERRFKEEAPRGGVLHLSTHGFFQDCPASSETEEGAAPRGRWLAPPAVGVEGPLVRTGLVLSEAVAGDRRDGKDDGFLTAEEIGAIDLSRARWVVLSACETARGVIESREGLLGLRRAFAIAGAGGVVVSLWPVPDDVARAYMRRFYDSRTRENAGLAAAGRAASLALLGRLRSAGIAPSPALWTPFVATGVDLSR